MEPPVYLIDLEGEVVYTWQMPYLAQYGYLTERGMLFYNDRTAQCLRPLYRGQTV